MDRSGADFLGVCKAGKRKNSAAARGLQPPIGEEDGFKGGGPRWFPRELSGTKRWGHDLRKFRSPTTCSGKLKNTGETPGGGS